MTEQTFGNVFSKHFSNERNPNRVLPDAKSALKIRLRMVGIVCSAFQNPRWYNDGTKSLLVALIDVLIYVFHTHFDRGLNVLLFVRHNAIARPMHAS